MIPTLTPPDVGLQSLPRLFVVVLNVFCRQGVCHSVCSDMLSSADFAGGTGEVVVQYERQLSPGNIGSIWLGRLATGSETGRLVTIRRVPLDLLTNDDVERVRLGAGACARLRSPSLVKLLGVAELDGELISVSEYLAGIRLIDLERALIESEVSIPVGVATRLIVDIARATITGRRLLMNIGVLAPNRIVLSDNALIALFGEALLTDVGVISALLRSPRIAQLAGVSADLAPEEIGTNPAQPGSPEVYTLGVALWQLLTNRWVQLPQGGARVYKEPGAKQSIPPVDTVERMGLPVPEPLARALRQATHRDPRKRFTSLEALVDALEQLPANCVASSGQVQEFIQQTAPQLLPECEASATWSLPLRLEPAAPPSRPITLHPKAAHDWEPPTFAERRLVAPVVTSERPRESEIEGAIAVNSIEPRNAHRVRTMYLMVGAALAVMVSTLLIIRLAQHRSSPQLAADSSVPVQPATDTASPLVARSANNPSQPEPEQTPVERNAGPLRQQDVVQNANPFPRAEKQEPSANPNGPYRPRRIAPYRPKGI